VKAFDKAGAIVGMRAGFYELNADRLADLVERPCQYMQAFGWPNFSVGERQREKADASHSFECPQKLARSRLVGFRLAKFWHWRHWSLHHPPPRAQVEGKTV